MQFDHTSDINSKLYFLNGTASGKQAQKVIYDLISISFQNVTWTDTTETQNRHEQFVTEEDEHIKLPLKHR